MQKLGNAPLPVNDFRHIDPKLVDIPRVLDELLFHLLT